MEKDRKKINHHDCILETQTNITHADTNNTLQERFGTSGINRRVDPCESVWEHDKALCAFQAGRRAWWQCLVSMFAVRALWPAYRVVHICCDSFINRMKNAAYYMHSLNVHVRINCIKKSLLYIHLLDFNSINSLEKPLAWSLIHFCLLWPRTSLLETFLKSDI